jgi:hypothetical protein
MKLIIPVIFGLGFMLSSCAASSGARPALIAGNYYMVGNLGCSNYYPEIVDGQPRLKCFDDQNRFMAYQRPMNGYEVQAYNNEQIIKAQQMQALQQTIDQNNKSMAQTTQSVLGSMQGSTPPVAADPSQPGTDWVYCRQMSSYTVHCRE